MVALRHDNLAEFFETIRGNGAAMLHQLQLEDRYRPLLSNPPSPPDMSAQSSAVAFGPAPAPRPPETGPVWPSFNGGPGGLAWGDLATRAAISSTTGSWSTGTSSTRPPLPVAPATGTWSTRTRGVGGRATPAPEACLVAPAPPPAFALAGDIVLPALARSGTPTVKRRAVMANASAGGGLGAGLGAGRVAGPGGEPVAGEVAGSDALLKRAIDLVAALVLLALTLPLFTAVAAALWVDSPGRLFFVQRRIGRGGRAFGCIKLRTMREDAEAVLASVLAASPRARREWEADHKLRNDPRITRLGRLVRKLSLDELPQLLNVLRGEMSLVGPRPIVAAEVARYGAGFADYCAVKPGITGLWQVSGRNDLSYAERVQLDRHYVRHHSLQLDLRIALRTVPAILLGQGCY